jgi:hypothetical protein
MSGGSANLPAGRPGSARSDSCARARHCRWRSGLCSRSPASGPRAASRSRDSPRPAVSLAASGRFRGPLSAARYRLAGAGLVTPDAVESGRGPLRTIYAVTPQGREFVRAWLAAPVDHVRDVRSHLLVKLALLDRLGSDAADLLRRQRAGCSRSPRQSRPSARTDRASTPSCSPGGRPRRQRRQRP